MKKLILIPILFVALYTNAQKIYQNITSDLKGKIVCCVDTIEHSDYSCQQVKELDSVSVGIEYIKFLDMCNDITNYETKSFIIQLTPKQLFNLGTPPRIIIHWNEEEQRIVRYSELSETGKKVFNDFIYKVKSL
jgi:hypothetical protein